MGKRKGKRQMGNERGKWKRERGKETGTGERGEKERGGGVSTWAMSRSSKQALCGRYVALEVARTVEEGF